MRIVAGTFRGRTLVAPKGQSTRPTADRTRQAIFDVLEHAPWAAGLEGARTMDLFAGAGALGLEAISRGAAFCLFVDRSAAARAAIGGNVAALGVQERARVSGWDASAAPARAADTRPFDLVFLDPPYGKGLGEPALARLAEGGWLADGAVAVLERGLGDPTVAVAGFARLDQRAWGAARVSFLRFEAAAA